MGYVTEKCQTLEEAKQKWEEIDFGLCRSAKPGDKFNHLTIKYRTGGNKRPEVVCQCDCENHNYIKVRLDHLKNGHTKSCGCVNLKQITELGKSCALDLTGQHFGKLTAIRPTGESAPNGNLYWECLCECDNIHIADTGSLKYNHTRACPFCKAKSSGEEKIIQILKENNIKFDYQKKFDDCRFENTNKLARFDFYIDNKYIIEFDGIQHFEARGNGWNTEENLIKTQEHDKFKNQYCFEHNIPIIRIPYTHLKDICLEDLIPETSQFLLKQEE